LIFKKAEEEE